MKVLMRHFGYILSKAFREAKRDGQMNGQSMLIAYMEHNKQSLNPFCIFISMFL